MPHRFRQGGTAAGTPATGANLVWPVLHDVAATILSALRSAPRLGTGELVAESVTGACGRVFVMTATSPGSSAAAIVNG